MRGNPPPSAVPLLTYIELYILSALLLGDNHGLGLIQSILDRTNGQLFLSPGTLYAALKRLYKSNWIKESEYAPPHADGNQERRRYYRLTSKGKAMIILELNRMETVAHEIHEILEQVQHHYNHQALHPISSPTKT
jgi:DNA-binding PadR family transcriptional regulator